MRLRLKDEDPDYRFFQDPDLPVISVTKERISSVKAMLKEIPFQEKLNFSKEYGLEISETKNIFRHKWSIPLFKQIANDYKI